MPQRTIKQGASPEMTPNAQNSNSSSPARFKSGSIRGIVLGLGGVVFFTVTLVTFLGEHRSSLLQVGSVILLAFWFTQAARYLSLRAATSQSLAVRWAETIRAYVADQVPSWERFGPGNPPA